ncbi:helix-turn-helix domain-containing protein [Ochrobactrum grignonense]|nr:helix-turn-helix domain-containing protein [Brucella grignonensis]
MSAKEAAAELNVSVATLYAYVSRGIIQSEARPGTRVRRYRTADIRSLAEKSKVSGKHSDAANILTFGIPILDSEITYTDSRYLYFRGRDSSLLATTSTNLESVAALIWDCDDRQVFTEPAPVLPVEESLSRSALGVGHPLILCQAMLPMIGEKDWRAYDFSKNGVCRTGTCILRLVTS